MKQERKKNLWMRFRHRIVRNIACVVLYPWARLKFGVQIEHFQLQGDRQYLIVYNHQTVFDQFFVGMSFHGPVYYLATEDLFSNGWISRVIQYLAAPIPIKKQVTDVQAVKKCLRVAKEGGTIALAPEGNRTYSGRTGYINPAVVKLARALKLPVAIYRIEGGYGVQPRWSDVIRKGTMRAYVYRVVEPEEYQVMTDDEFFALIRNGIFVNEAEVSGTFFHRRSAEYLERVMYVCPDCGLTTFESRGNTILCTGCSRKVRYLPTKELEGVEEPFPFRFVADWYDAQCSFVNRLDPSQYREVPAYRDIADLSEVVLYQKKRSIQKDAEIALYGDCIEIREEGKFPFDEISVVTVLGRNKLNFYHDGRVYQLKGGKRFNAVKYVNFFYHYKNISEDYNYGTFLGL